MQWLAIGWVDAAMLGVMVVSVLVGAVRGITFELLSLAGWFAAWFAGLWLGPVLAPYLPVGSPGSALNRGLAFASAFLACSCCGAWRLARSRR
ncbi:MAG: CvpA family protein [Caldimonas sp.]